jgi:hypothetical protein
MDSWRTGGSFFDPDPNEFNELVMVYGRRLAARAGFPRPKNPRVGVHVLDNLVTRHSPVDLGIQNGAAEFLIVEP